MHKVAIGAGRGFRLRSPAPLLGIAVICAGLALLSGFRGERNEPRDARGIIERTGTITGWSVEDSGSVAFRIEGKDKRDRPFKTWFVTPSNQTSSTQFEELILDAVLKLRASRGRDRAGWTPPVVTAMSNTSNELSGSSLDGALPLKRLSQRQ